MNLTGLGLGLFMLFAIGFGFFWVIKVEYYLGARVWKAVLAIGLLVCLASLFSPSFLGSALLGILGGSVVWGATELPDQEKRVQRGHFPANPRRTQSAAAISQGAFWGLQWAGVILALVTFTTIGFGHVLVRRLHARYRTKPAVPLFVTGGLVLAASLLSPADLLSGVLGITGITLLWDGIEMFRQEKRFLQGKL